MTHLKGKPLFGSQYSGLLSRKGKGGFTFTVQSLPNYPEIFSINKIRLFVSVQRI